MKIELKNIQYSQALSEETYAFSATLYIEGKRAGEASNHGHGGPTDYGANDGAGRKLIREAEAYCKALPPVHYPANHGMEAFDVPMTLEHYINDLLEKFLNQKELKAFQAKLAKYEKDNIIVGVPDEKFSTLKLKFPIDLLLAHPHGAERIKDILVAKVIPEMQPGEMLLNTNIPKEIYEKAGLTESQYVKPANDKPKIKSANKPKPRR